MSPRSTAAVIPQYAQIAHDLRGQIRSGHYAPGALLPSRNEIIAEYGVSAITARDALSVLCHEGYAKAIRGRGHVVRRRHSRLTLPGRMYGPAIPGIGTPGDPGGGVELRLARADVYQETAPDNIALPLESGDATVWVRRTVWVAADDRQPAQIHVSWLPGLGDDAGQALRDLSPDVLWPEAVRQATGREPAAVLQNVRARGANPFEAGVFGIPGGTKVFVAHLTLYDEDQHPIEHSRYAWPVEAIRLSDRYPCAIARRPE
jgi:GntR family transcriptional regulator